MEDQTRMPRTTWERHIEGVAGVLVVGSAIWMGVTASMTSPPVWFTLIFEIVLLVVGVVLVTMWRGSARSGHALGLLCVAGGLVLPGVISYHTAKQSNLLDLDLIRGVLMMRLGLGVGAVLLSSWIALRRDTARSLPRLTSALVVTAVTAGVGAGFWFGLPKLTTMGPVVQAIGIVAGSGVLLGLLAASAHLWIVTFESACTPDSEPIAD